MKEITKRNVASSLLTFCSRDASLLAIYEYFHHNCNCNDNGTGALRVGVGVGGGHRRRSGLGARRRVPFASSRGVRGRAAALQRTARAR